MGDLTEIAWTDATWNPWQGCHKVSEACKNCYMFRDKKRYGKDANVVVRSADSTFCKPLTWARNQQKYGHIQRVFTCSWSDFFIEEADPWRDEAWDIIRKTPQFQYQILTKRPERFTRCSPKFDVPNAIVGFTAENQERFNERLDAVKRLHDFAWFVSVEPMLGPIDMDLMMPYKLYPAQAGHGPSFVSNRHHIGWVICGCESGPNARETKIEWVRDLRDQCQAAGIPFFLKQLMIDGKLVSTPELDGRKHVEFPARETKKGR